MALVPLAYNLRSLWVRRASTFLTVFSIAATVAVLAGVISLEQGFTAIFAESGRRDVAVFWRPGAQDEGSSIFKPEYADVLIKNSPDIELDASGQPLAAAEMFLAILREKVDAGGVVFVPIRGVQPMSFTINADRLRTIEGRDFAWGNDEVVVGRKLVGRIADCRIGDVLMLNTTPFRVVGVIDDSGPFAGEIWGDLERLRVALKRDAYNRVIAKLKPDVDWPALQERQRRDKQVPADVYSELDANLRATERLSRILTQLGMALAAIMGVAAVFTGINSMLSAIASRTHEIGVLKSIGFTAGAIFSSFLFESVLVGIVGGVVGCALSLPLNGIQTGAMNFNTFTDVTFAFKTTPTVLVTAFLFSLLLGIVGGAWPAWRAARMRPTEALRHE
ncbi:MAG: ABC transporter permease [Planctomycetes bacterium]|nr:ABC transporter permease [Planctomycetota bacterium]